LVGVVAAVAKATFVASSNMVRCDEDDEVEEDEYEQSRRDVSQKSYHLSPSAGSERLGFGDLLFRMDVHVVGGME
jgi:hypothetical protein